MFWRGKFLTTNGGLGELLNVGFFALRPDKRLFQAAVQLGTDNFWSITSAPERSEEDPEVPNFIKKRSKWSRFVVSSLQSLISHHANLWRCLEDFA